MLCYVMLCYVMFSYCAYFTIFLSSCHLRPVLLPSSSFNLPLSYIHLLPVVFPPYSCHISQPFLYSFCPLPLFLSPFSWPFSILFLYYFSMYNSVQFLSYFVVNTWLLRQFSLFLLLRILYGFFLCVCVCIYCLNNYNIILVVLPWQVYI